MLLMIIPFTVIICILDNMLTKGWLHKATVVQGPIIFFWECTVNLYSFDQWVGGGRGGIVPYIYN